MYVAGGTDLYPNMKRRHQEPRTVISLMGIRELAGCEMRDAGCVLGSCMTLTELSASPPVRQSAPAVGEAAGLVSTPLLRNMGTLGGNLCLDTRCNYYNQSYEWRKAIDFCMKKDGHICWVAPSSPRCWAVSSSDVAPVMVALGADYVLVGPGGERVVPAARFYHNDGINYLDRKSTRLNSSHLVISYAVFCLKKKTPNRDTPSPAATGPAAPALVSACTTMFSIY